MQKDEVNKRLEKAMDRFLEIDFQNIEKENLICIVNELYVYYKEMADYQYDERDKRRFKNNILLGLDEAENKVAVDRFKRDNIKCLIESEETVISYVYGAYIANRIAHQFKTKVRRKRINFNEGNRIAKKSYALKSLFTKYIIDGLKETSRYEFGWGKDKKTGLTALSINITPYSNKKLNEYYKSTGKTVNNIYISLHIIDPELTNAITDLPNNVLKNSNTPTEIFNQADNLRNLYKDLGEER